MVIYIDVYSVGQVMADRKPEVASGEIDPKAVGKARTTDGGAPLSRDTSEKPRRSRRTPEEARRLVLGAAAARLAEHGLKGLNVVDVAKDAGMTHATVLHHFGSAEKMQRALVQEMTATLLQDLMIALDGKGDLDGGELCDLLFDALSRKGHGKLIAWASATDQRIAEEFRDARGALFGELVQSLSTRLQMSEATARRMVYLTATSALGAALTGAALARRRGMSREEAGAFPEWLSKQMDRGIEDEG